MALSERDRRALVRGGIALGVIAVYFLGIDPLLAWYDALVSRHEANAASVARVITNQRKAGHYRDQVSEMEEEVGGLSTPKPYSEQITAMSEKVITAAQQSGLNLKGATPTAAIAWPEDPSLKQASILIDAEAGWENVFKFIAALYRTEGVLSVEQIELSGEGGKVVKLTISVLVKAPESSDDPWAG